MRELPDNDPRKPSSPHRPLPDGATWAYEVHDATIERDHAERSQNLQPEYTIARGSGGSRGKKRKKRLPKRTCRACKLQWCDCDPRPKILAGRVTEAAHAYFKGNENLSSGEVLEKLAALAIKYNLRLDELLQIAESAIRAA